jgi:hypothetical protein
MNRISVVCGTILLLVCCTFMFSSEASAQKKKTPPKSEQATEQPAPPPVPGKLGNTIKEVLTKYRGEKTNLGTLSRIESDYFVVEEDGVATLHPLSIIIGIKILKMEEGADEDQPKIEIILMR